MVILLLIIGIAILIYASIMWIKFVWFVFTPKKKPTNPYIEAQKTIMDNDKNYDEYIEWMQKKGAGFPVDKIKHKEEQDIENAVNKTVFRIFK